MDWDEEFHKAAMSYRNASVILAPEAYERLVELAKQASIADTAGAKLDEAKGILRLFYEACTACDPETGPYLDTNKLHEAHEALCAKGVQYLRGSDGNWPIAAPPAPSVADAAGASEHPPENINWTRVMALAEKHGDGWSDEKGWSFHCDDDLFNFAGELAKESGND